MDSSQKYLLAGTFSFVVALAALGSGGFLLFKEMNAPMPSPLPSEDSPVIKKQLPPIPTPVPIATTTGHLGLKSYTSETYGVSFDYPSTWVLASDLSFAQQNIQVSFADSFYLKDAGDFNTGLLTYLNSICSADGPTGSIQCLAKDATISPYTNPRGVKGYKISLIKTEEKLLPVKSTTLTPETVYAYPIEDHDAFAIVFSPTLSATEQPKDLQRIADSLH